MSYNFPLMNLKKLIFALPVCGIVFGTLIAVFFGANEEMFKNHIKSELLRSEQIVSISDPVKQEAKMKTEEEKLWRYFQRFHFHSTGIASMSLALLLLLFFAIEASQNEKLFWGLGVSASGFLYPFYWLLAGYFGPSIGRGVAKEQFAIFGYMGGVFLVAAIGVLYLLLRRPMVNGTHSKPVN